MLSGGVVECPVVFGAGAKVFVLSACCLSPSSEEGGVLSRADVVYAEAAEVLW